jgi:hypothetical protein
LATRTGTWVERGLGTTELNTAAGVQAVKSLATSSFIASRKLIVEVGGFNEKLRSGEDSELSERLVARGYSLISHPGSHVTHYGYPRSLTDVYRKQIWHGSNQLEASSEWSLTLALSHLTLIALLVLVSALPVAVLSGHLAAYVAFAALCGLFAPPCVYALKRMRTQSASPLQLSRWFLIGAAYFLGRAHGLLTNYWRRLTT